MDQTDCQSYIVMNGIKNKMDNPQNSYYNVDHKCNYLNMKQILTERQISFQGNQIQNLVDGHRKKYQIGKKETLKFYFGIETYQFIKEWVVNKKKIQKPSDLLQFSLAYSYLILWILSNLLKQGKQVNDYQELENDSNEYLQFIFLLFKTATELKQNLVNIYKQVISEQENFNLNIKQYQQFIESFEGQYDLYNFDVLETLFEDLLEGTNEYIPKIQQQIQDKIQKTKEKYIEEVKNKKQIILEIQQKLKIHQRVTLNREKSELLNATNYLYQQVIRAIQQNKDFYLIFVNYKQKLLEIHSKQLKRFLDFEDKLKAKFNNLKIMKQNFLDDVSKTITIQ
ncbi:unnamed protein product [Paramecium sonneborni]|uniref:Uncharacterized protein n=1 Tax=Paramecium sonneborni TaxID=65129 RepID=A0A8S1RHP3_9CILI|nr:unnamed protein product [Paramecium sonneborni]